MSNDKQRRPVSSRTTTSRPRKIAGRAESDPTDRPAAEPSETESLSLSKPAKAAKAATPAKPSRTVAAPRPLTDRLSLFAGRSLTRVLMIALAVLALVVAGQGIWFGVKGNDHHAPAQVAQGTVDVPADRPVQMNQSDIDQGVDQAAQDAVTLMGLHYKTYDTDVAKALDLTTTRFAPQYKQLTADAKSGYLAKQVDLAAKVIGEGVVKASTTRLPALLFVNQFVSRGRGKDRRVVLTSYRVLMTMVHTNTGWLVDGMDTQ
ncbi:MAG TPA: hypothetical protein VN088_03915 [Nocardioides sp.]|nr:hypothetical protein [Nocardioides sp.]